MTKSVTMMSPQCAPWRVAIASDRSGDVAIIDSQNRIVGEFFAEVDRGVHAPADAFDRANLVCELVNNWDSVRHLARLLPLPETSEVLSGKVFEHSDPLYLMRMLESVTPRANTFAIENYVKALEGDGPLACDWDDKPHRLVYDLVAAWLYQQKTIAKLCEGWAKGASNIAALQMALGETVNFVDNTEHQDLADRWSYVIEHKKFPDEA